MRTTGSWFKSVFGSTKLDPHAKKGKIKDGVKTIKKGKLSDDKVRAIRKALKTMTRGDVAKTEGVSIYVVNGIADELNYTAVKDE